MFRRTTSVLGQSGVWILDIEPTSMPALVRGFERKGKILLPQSPSELKVGAPNYTGVSFIWLGLEKEDATEECEMWADAQKGFTEMNKVCNMDNGIRVEMVNIDPIKFKDNPEKL